MGALDNLAGLLIWPLYERKTEEASRPGPPVLLDIAMMLASAGMASALPGGIHGQGAAHANPNATFGIAVAISHNFSGGGGCGGAGGACE